VSIIEHILLFSLLFVVYAFWGKHNVNKSGINYWLAAIFPILLYVFIIGSRYGWGADYLWYRVQYECDILDPSQITFNWLNQFLHFIEFNYVGAFMVYAFIFIVCAFVFLRSYGSSSKFMFCFLVPATIYISCHTIRQGLGMAFVLLALTFFFQRKWLLMVLIAGIAYYFHSVTIITLLTIVGISIFIKKPIHYWISIPLFLFFAFVFDVGKIGFIADILSNYISLDNKFQEYIDSSDKWFGEDAMNTHWAQGTFTLIMSSLYAVSLFYVGYKALKKIENKQVLIMYNTVVLGMIMTRAVFLYELFRRLTSPMEMFYFVPLGYIFYIYFQECKQPENIQLKKTFRIGIGFIMAYLIMFWGRFLFVNPQADFFWRHLDDSVNIQQFFDITL